MTQLLLLITQILLAYHLYSHYKAAKQDVEFWKKLAEQTKKLKEEVNGNRNPGAFKSIFN
jgi:hypothetical protein